MSSSPSAPEKEPRPEHSEGAAQQPATEVQAEATDTANQPDTSDQDQGPRPIPGTEVVGRGIYLRPRVPYALKRQLLRPGSPREYYCAETGRTYQVPCGMDVNNSPPMPAQNAINSLNIEESWERLDNHLSFDANLASGNTPFSIDVNSSQASQLRAEEDAYYALRNSFVPLFSVYVPDVEALTPIDPEDIEKLPTPFRHRHRDVYEKFFEKYGTHFVRRAWVGGKATLAFTILKSSKLETEDIKEAITASFAPAGDGSAKHESKESKEKLQSNSQCTVWGKGGSAMALAALSSLDEDGYAHWLHSIERNPEAIELEVAGIWTLLQNEPDKTEALMKAYKAASTFTPISTVFSVGRFVVFLRDDQCLLYDVDKGETMLPFKMADAWKDLPMFGFDRVDAAFSGDVTETKDHLCTKVYAFRKGKCLTVEVRTPKSTGGAAADEGKAPWPTVVVPEGEYPKPLSEVWPGVMFDRIDAIMDAGEGDLYFFRGDEYLRFDAQEMKVPAEYPQKISRRWVGVTFDRIDAAIYWGSGKAYFFRGDQHVRYDMVSYRADPGYPKFIPGSYVEDWKFF